MPQLPSAIAGMPYRGARPYTQQERYQLFSQGTGAYNQPGFGPTSGVQMPQAGQPMGPAGQRMGGQMPWGQQPAQAPQQFQQPPMGQPQMGQPQMGGQQQMPQQGFQQGGFQPQLRVSSPTGAQPGMAQHLSDLLSQRNQGTALELKRGASLANAQHGLASQRARSQAGLGWAGIKSSDDLAAMQNQMDIVNAIIRMLGGQMSGLGGF